MDRIEQTYSVLAVLGSRTNSCASLHHAARPKGNHRPGAGRARRGVRPAAAAGAAASTSCIVNAPLPDEFGDAAGAESCARRAATGVLLLVQAEQYPDCLLRG